MFQGELRHALRLFGRSPGFSLAALAALSVGIGAPTAIFSVVDAVLLKALPFRNADRLVVLWEKKPSGNNLDTPVLVSNFLAWQRQDTSLSSLAAIQDVRLNLVAGPKGRIDPEEIKAEKVSATLFPELGVQPALGRAFRPEEDQPGHDGVVLLGHSLWMRRFGGNRGILGQNVQLGDRTYTVLGVLPPRFTLLEPEVEAWVPLALQTGNVHVLESRMLVVIARLRAGISMERASEELAALGRRLEQANPALNRGYRPAIYSLREQIVGDVQKPLMVIAGAVALLLLLACANVANLLLARGAGRQKEIAARMALGASRVRLLGQFILEGLLLSLAGGVLGCGLAAAGVAGLARLGAESIPNLANATIDLRVFAFTLAVSAAAGMLFGMAPAAQISSRRINSTLTETARGGTLGRSGRRLRSVLVVFEIAIALVVLVEAGLLLRSFVGLRSYRLGYQPHGVLTLRVPLNGGRNAASRRRIIFFRQLLDRVSLLPGVQAVSAVNTLPLTGLDPGTTFALAGRPPLQLTDHPIALLRASTPGYFRTMGIALLAGRDFTDADTAEAPAAMIIDKVLADRYWPGDPRAALGTSISIDVATAGRVAEIVGVVGSVRPDHLNPDLLARNWPTIYNPYPQTPFSTMIVTLRTAGEPRAVASAVEHEVRGLDPEQPVTDVRSMDDIADAALASARFSTFVLAVFAGIAFVLAAVGIYGVVAYDVGQRVQEMGIRMALGAQGVDIMRLVLGQGAILAGCGIGLGLLAAFFVSRFLENMLYGVKSTDVFTFAGVAVLLAAVSLAACYVPSRRAMHLDPMAALRQE